MRIPILSSVVFILSQSCFATDYAVVPVNVTAKKPVANTVTHSPKLTITRQEIAETGATSVSQILQELGGVQLQDVTGNGSQVAMSLRGFGANASSNTLLLINGIPISNPDMAPPDLNSIPLQEIKSIEIISGSESVLYGDQAVGGAINIITRDESKEKISLMCGTGSYNAKNCFAALQNHYRNLSYGLDVLGNVTDNYRDRNVYSQNLLNGRLNYPYQSGNLAFRYQVANERMQYPGALTVAQVAQNRRQANSNINFFRDWNGSYHLKDLQQLSDNWRLETDLARRETHGDGVLTSPFNQTRTIHFVKPQIKGVYEKAVITTGVDFEEDGYRLQSLYGVSNDQQDKYGLFGIANYALTPKLSISAGARGGQQNNELTSSQNMSYVSRALATTLGGSYELTPNAKWYLRRAESFRFPKADENASVPLGVNGLKTQRGVSYETGVRWNWKNSLSKFSIYQLNLKDEIMFNPLQTPLQPFGANVNLAPTQRQGFSVSEKYLVTEKLILDGQYNFVNARFQRGIDAGNRIPLVSQNIFRTGLNYAFKENWNLYTEAIYTGNQFSDNDNGNVAGPMGGYTLYNFNVRYHFKEFSAAFRLNNFFNKYFYYYTVYQAPSQFFYPAPGRNFVLTLKYVFL
jgi:iron complex outermembrane receptor protein